MNYRNAAAQGNPGTPGLVGDTIFSTYGPTGKPEKLQGEKSQGALHRSERATIVLAAKESWGKRMTAKDKQEIEKLAEEIAVNSIKNEAMLMEGGKPSTNKLAIEFALRKMVANAGLGKLAKKNVLRNGQQRKLRASQLVLAIEGANQNTEEE